MPSRSTIPHEARTARAGGEARVALHGHVPEAPLPQGRVLRHVVGHLPVPALDVPVPQMVDQLPDVEHFFRALSPDPEQVIEVPKFLPLDVPTRAAVRVPQLAEQLVEVPTILSYSSLLQRTVSSTSTFQFLVVVEDQVLVLKVFPLDSVQQRRLPGNAFLSGSWSRSLTLFLVEVFMVHLLLTLQLVMKHAQMSLAKGFFALFPKIKKVRSWARTRVGTAPRSSPSTPTAQLRRVGAAQGTPRWQALLLEQTHSSVYLEATA